MPLSKVALMCLETSPYLFSILNEGTTYVDAQTLKRNEHFEIYFERLKNCPSEFASKTSVSLETFQYILENIRTDLESVNIGLSHISPEEMLFVTLRYLATGMSYNSLANILQSRLEIVHSAIFITLQIIWSKLSGLHLRTPSPAEMSELAAQYYHKWSIPNCIGAIGGKYVRLLKRTNRKIDNPRKKIILNAVVDANFRFVVAEVISDKDQETDTLFKDIFDNVGMQRLPGTEVTLPLVIIGNEAYPLKSYLLKPYAGKKKSLTHAKKMFNNRLNLARVPVDCAFEILTEKWKIYTRPLVQNLTNAKLVIKVTCLLHNIIKDRDGHRDEHFTRFGETDNGTIYLNLVSRKSMKNNRASAIALSIREQLATFILEQEMKVQELVVLDDK